MEEIQEQKLELPNNQYITYKIFQNDSQRDFIIFYFHGFNSSMQSPKIQIYQEIAKKYNIKLITLNYLGHGTSSGKLEDFTMEDWFNNIKEIISLHSEDKNLIFSGSSLGGWFSFICGQYYKEKVKGIFTTAPAIDFFTVEIEPLIKDKNAIYVHQMDFGNGSIGPKITNKLYTTSKKFNLLDKNNLEFNCPVRIIHGLKDPTVNYNTSIRFCNMIKCDKCRMILEKEMNHDLSLKGNTDILKIEFEDFIKNIINAQ